MSDGIFASAELVNKMWAALKKAQKAGLSETECTAIYDAVVAKAFEVKK